MKSSLRGCRIAGWRVRGHRTACRNPGRLDTDRRGAGRRKGDPPRESPRDVDVGGARAPGRSGRADLRGSSGGAGARTAGSPSGLRPSSVGCSRRGPGRSACRWRTRPGSEGISPTAASPSGNPRPAVRSDEEHGRRRSQIHPNVRQSGLVELVCLRRQGLVHSRIRSSILRVLTCFERR
jgi:hypothetical protein